MMNSNLTQDGGENSTKTQLQEPCLLKSLALVSAGLSRFLRTHKYFKSNHGFSTCHGSQESHGHSTPGKLKE